METGLRFGIMGAGRIAGKFCDAIRQVEGAELIAVASKSEERAKAFAEKNQVADWYAGYEDMLKRDDINIVYIATTNNFHFENIMQCLKAKKHVMCEKAMVGTEEEARAAFAAAEAGGLFLMECMWVRFLPKIKKVKQWLSEGRIGNITLAQATLGFTAEKDMGGRMYNRELGGGSLFDVGVYPIEILSWLIGERVQSVHSFVKYAQSGVDESVSLNLAFETCFAGIECSIGTMLPEDGYLYGPEGFIRLPKMHTGSSVELYDRNRQLAERFTQNGENTFNGQIREALACIRDGRTESGIASHAMTIECARIFDSCLKGTEFRPL